MAKDLTEGGAVCTALRVGGKRPLKDACGSLTLIFL